MSPAGAIQLLRERHHIRSCHTGVLGTLENLLLAHSSVVEVALETSSAVTMVLNSLTYAQSLPQQILYYSVVALYVFFKKTKQQSRMS